MIQKLYAQNKWLIFAGVVLVTIYFTWLMNAALPFEKMINIKMIEKLMSF